MKHITSLLFTIITALILVLSVRGIPGNPTHETINNEVWKNEGPLELSPERGRYALTYSLFEDNSFSFAVPIARFAAPDLGYIDGRYVSLFAPGISYIIAPGFIIGSYFDSAQVGTYAIIAMFAFLNTFLIRAIALKLKAHPAAAMLAGVIFLFGSPAFVYGVSLYQHHISTFIILLSIYILLRFKSYWWTAVIWFFCAVAIPVDYPNLFLMFPIGLYALSRIVVLGSTSKSYAITLHVLGPLTFLTMAIPFAFFTHFNTMSYGNPFQFSGTVESVKVIDESGNPALADGSTFENSSAHTQKGDKKTAQGFFKTRNITNGLYVHTISPDRGILWYTPVMALGILGLFVLYKKHSQYVTLFTAIISINIILYSMWGDPWGGWAFGSRYLIPSYAIASIGIASIMTHWRKRTMFLLMISIAIMYSVFVNALGALTTSRIPPYVEILSLESVTGKVEKYSFDRNIDILADNISKSYVFQTWANNYFHATEYYLIIVSVIAILVMTLIGYLYHGKENIYVND